MAVLWNGVVQEISKRRRMEQERMMERSRLIGEERDRYSERIGNKTDGREGGVETIRRKWSNLEEEWGEGKKLQSEGK